MKQLAIMLVSVGLAAGCVSQATKQHVSVQKAAHDGACRLIEQTVSGRLPPELAQDHVTQDQLDRTPASVRRLLGRMTRFVYENRKSYYTFDYTLGDGPDPAALTFSDPPAAIVSFR